MLIENSKQTRQEFQKFKRPLNQYKTNDKDHYLMALDFIQETDMKQKCKSILNINCIDKNKDVFLLRVINFKTYFYSQAPQFTEEKLKKRSVEEFLKEVVIYLNKIFNNSISHINIVQKESFQNFKGQSDSSSEFLQIFFNDHNFLSKVSSHFQKGFDYQQVQFKSLSFENNVNFSERLLIDMDISGMSWIHIPAKKYRVLPMIETNSRCLNEFEIKIENLISLPTNHQDFQEMAPLRIMSFDIECHSYGKLPQPKTHQVCTIGIVCKDHNKLNDEFKVTFQLGTCDEIIGCNLYVFQKEEQLLNAFDIFMEIYNPDVITGYNILSFDLKYLLERRKVFKLDYPYWGRGNDATNFREGKFNSKMMGFRQTIKYNMFGRIILDMYIHMMKEHKLSSYKLNSVAFEFLGDSKEEVHHTMISTLQDGTAQTRYRLAYYCLKDAILPLQLCDKLKCIYNYAEMARVTGIPIGYLFDRGQQIKIKCQILKNLKNTKLIMPGNTKTGDNEQGYQGADVLKPKVGYYNIPIATLDFASLYPSIMISHNLCYSTLTSQKNVNNLKEGEDYLKTPNGFIFVLPKQRIGVLPIILQNLLSARKQAKKELGQIKQQLKELEQQQQNTFENKESIEKLKNLIAVYDGRQLALKISANSVYGFTGAGNGAMPCLEIASSVTSIGRQMIDKTKNLVMQHFSIANGYKCNADVIYGDTDSVMINFGTDSVEESMKLGIEAAQILSENFMKPIKLEFEKVYFPYLLLSKKRYAGLLWTNPEKPDKKDCKGVESVRRDSCLLVRKMVDTVLEIILYEKDFQKAVDFCKSKVYDLLNNRIDISQLIITKSLSREIDSDQYKTNQAHVELARKLERTQNLKFNIGDRIPFVIIAKGQKAKQYEKSEDPQIAFDQNLPLDYVYYLEKQIQPPIERIFNAILDTKTIFEGNHTRKQITQKISSTKGIGMFFQKVDQICLNCKKPYAKNTGKKTVCDNCKDQEKGLYLKTIFELKQKEKIYQKLWSECQRCEGSALTEVICANSFCPIYFKRKSMQTQMKEIHEKIQKFDYQQIIQQPYLIKNHSLIQDFFLIFQSIIISYHFFLNNHLFFHQFLQQIIWLNLFLLLYLNFHSFFLKLFPYFQQNIFKYHHHFLHLLLLIIIIYFYVKAFILLKFQILPQKSYVINILELIFHFLLNKKIILFLNIPYIILDLYFFNNHMKVLQCILFILFINAFNLVSFIDLQRIYFIHHFNLFVMFIHLFYLD